MGNCIRKSLCRETNQHVDTAQLPNPTGLNEINISNLPKASKSLGEVNLHAASNKKKGMNENINYCIRKPPKPPQMVTTSSFASNTLQASHPHRSSKSLQERNLFVPSNTSNTHGEKERNNRYGNLVAMNEVVHAYKLNCFRFHTLKVATQKFSDTNLIGQGGSGDVFRGWIDLRTMTARKPGRRSPNIAVKVLRNGTLGREEWQNELNFLSRFHHPNMVKLIGYCSDEQHRILVFEYMPRRSLETHLSGESRRGLNWRTRIKIAIGSARGLAYLHTFAPPVIHRDVKSSNILLDKDFTPKLSDFGFAKFGPIDDESHILTRVLGTRGYFAPEYMYSGRLTIEADIYSFGVVLLEILSGSAAIKRFSNGQDGNLAQWAIPYLNNQPQLHRIIDKKLIRSLQMAEAYWFAKIIGQCLNSDPENRPSMTEVVSGLEKLDRNVKKTSYLQSRFASDISSNRR